VSKKEKDNVRTLTIQREDNKKEQRTIAISWRQKQKNVRIYIGIKIEKLYGK